MNISCLYELRVATQFFKLHKTQIAQFIGISLALFICETEDSQREQAKTI